MKTNIVTSMDNKTIIESATKIGELQTGTYLPLFLYQASEKNTRLIAEKNLEQFTSWFNEHLKTVNCFQQLDETEFHNLLTQTKRSITNGFLHHRE
jgi:hypothetical protein